MDNDQTGFVPEMKAMMTAIAEIVVSVMGCALWLAGASAAVFAVFGESGNVPVQLFAGVAVAVAGGAILWQGRFVNRGLVTGLLVLLVLLGALQIPLMFMSFPWPVKRSQYLEFLLIGAVTLALLWRLKANWKKKDSTGRQKWLRT